jgi:hypothetical protein
LIWFSRTSRASPPDPRPLEIHGTPSDEFADSNHLPWQIYVRQGRRIEGRARVTQHNFIVDPKTKRTPRIEDAIAIGEHSFDIHPCHDRRYAVDGFMEGVLWYPKKAFGPAQPGQIPYGAMVPVRVDNLLVPSPSRAPTSRCRHPDGSCMDDHGGRWPALAAFDRDGASVSRSRASMPRSVRGCSS